MKKFGAIFKKNKPKKLSSDEDDNTQEFRPQKDELDCQPPRATET